MAFSSSVMSWKLRLSPVEAGSELRLEVRLSRALAVVMGWIESTGL